MNMLLLHTASLSWNNTTIVSGSRDRSILQWDYRTASHGNRPIRKLVGHSQEVCGLRWSPDHQLLASGGNDNKVSCLCIVSLLIHAPQTLPTVYNK